jgi:hypothetical protein
VRLPFGTADQPEEGAIQVQGLRLRLLGEVSLKPSNSGSERSIGGRAAQTLKGRGRILSRRGRLARSALAGSKGYGPLEPVTRVQIPAAALVLP